MEISVRTVKLTRVKFSELHEVEGAFGREWIAPAGGGFPKHLVYSYDIKTKTVVFPIGWVITESGGTNEDGWKRTEMEFYFRDFCHTILRHDLVKKIDIVEVEYDSKEFEPNKHLSVFTFRIPRRNKDRTDKLIQNYQIVAGRSRKSTKVITGVGHKKKSIPQYLYELAIDQSKWRDLGKELIDKGLIPKNDHFSIWVGHGVFPRQLTSFKKAN